MADVAAQHGAVLPAAVQAETSEQAAAVGPDACVFSARKYPRGATAAEPESEEQQDQMAQRAELGLEVRQSVGGSYHTTAGAAAAGERGSDSGACSGRKSVGAAASAPSLVLSERCIKALRRLQEVEPAPNGESASALT